MTTTKPKPHTETTVEWLPKCDFCNSTGTYDGKTKMGPWGSMCRSHFQVYGTGLGLGKGQKLVLKKKEGK